MTAERIPFVRVYHAETPNPSGCRWCGDDERSHGMQVSRSVGLHTWVAPTPEQRKARMKARRRANLARLVAIAGRGRVPDA